MEKLFQGFTTLFEDLMYGVAAVVDWFFTPWFTWGTGPDAVEIYPLMIFSVAGLGVIIAVMLIKFLNPLS